MALLVGLLIQGTKHKVDDNKKGLQNVTTLCGVFILQAVTQVLGVNALARRRSSHL